MSEEEFEARYGDLIYTEYDRQWLWNCIKGSAKLRDAELAAHENRRRKLFRAAYPKLSGIVVG